MTRHEFVGSIYVKSIYNAEKEIVGKNENRLNGYTICLAHAEWGHINKCINRLE